MRVTPYRKRNPFKTVVYVDAEGVYTSEHGDTIDPRNVPPNTRCFITWDNARRLTMEKHGESLLWKGEHIRWHPFQRPELTEWRPHLADAYVLRIPVHASTAMNLSELARWRDWLHEYGAVPATPGGSSLGLLKGTLRRTLWCSVGWDAKRIRQSAGGRIENGPAGQGVFHGQLFHHDLQAAYANGIGTVRYGGKWFPERDTSRRRLDRLTAEGVPVLVRARVYVPVGAPYGPLHTFATPKGLRGVKYHPFIRQLMRASGHAYPVGKRVQGWWTWEEVRLAADMGCSVTMLDAWKHTAPKDSPFRHWLAAVNQGRQMEGLAGTLAKVTGNALWGQFALDPTMYGRRSIRRYTRRGSRPTIVKLPGGGRTQLPAIDLAEIVAGRVRARLLAAMLQCGDDLLCAHTDGLWAAGNPQLGEQWRTKASARRVDLLTPQKLRYYPPRARPVTVYSGVPLEYADEAFDRDWSRYVQRTATDDTKNVPVLPPPVRVTEVEQMAGLPPLLPDAV